MSGCPVVHTSDGNGATSAATQPATAEARSGCPLAGKRGGPSTETVNPANAMPAPNQQPAPGQRLPLSKERVESTIPQATAQGNWVYPSPQVQRAASAPALKQGAPTPPWPVIPVHHTPLHPTLPDVLQRDEAKGL